jgi:hypothetical protein
MISIKAVGSDSNNDVEKGEDLSETVRPKNERSVSPVQQAEAKQTSNWKKPFSFYMASLSLWLAVLLVSLDSTGLAVAIPVGRTTVTIVAAR